MLKNIHSRNFGGEGGGKGDLEISRFDWVFLNVGLPYLMLHFIGCTYLLYSDRSDHLKDGLRGDEGEGDGREAPNQAHSSICILTNIYFSFCHG